MTHSEEHLKAAESEQTLAGTNRQQLAAWFEKLRKADKELRDISYGRSTPSHVYASQKRLLEAIAAERNATRLELAEAHEREGAARAAFLRAEAAQHA